MVQKSRVKKPNQRKRKVRAVWISLVIVAMVGVAFLFLSTPSSDKTASSNQTVIVSATSSRPEIIGDLYKQGYIKNRFSYYALLGLSFFDRNIKAGGYLLSKGMSFMEIYQNLANPYMRYVRIDPGLRKEQIADIYGNLLAWNDVEKQQFLNPTGTSTDKNYEGYYFPSTYLVPVNASGQDVSQEMLAKFNQAVKPESTKKNKKIVNVDTAVKIASIIQREAAGPQDMNLISGIIWNRLFAGMSLDMDATLQYAKGTDQNGWWPQVAAADKKIDSPYNTYANEGLPPSAISNPSLAAIDAAYNPSVTDCIFYLHDNNHQIHCSKTYEGQVANVNKYLK